MFAVRLFAGGNKSGNRWLLRCGAFNSASESNENTGDRMKRHVIALFSATLLIATLVMRLQAHDPMRTLVVTMTNDSTTNNSTTNNILVFDAATHNLLQTVSTGGK